MNRFCILTLTGLCFSLSVNNFTGKTSLPTNEFTVKAFFEDACSVEGYLDNIAGDTYAIKFTNRCDTTYKIYYQVMDKGKVIQDISSTVVKAKSGNSTGTIHCSPEAFVKITRKEKL